MGKSKKKRKENRHTGYGNDLLTARITVRMTKDEKLMFRNLRNEENTSYAELAREALREKYPDIFYPV